MRSLAEWLERQEKSHPSAIDLTLSRVREVARRLDLLAPAARVVTVGGTNGKGSTVACIDALLRAAGLRCGRFTSPHLARYNERICIDGIEASDASLIASFERIDAVRDEITLTFFEYNALAALDQFRQAAVDVSVLEVGLGGRLDATNIIDADVAVVTSIGLDHVDWLGDTLDAIGREKAGIFRAGRPAVCADAHPPSSVVAHAEEIGATLLRIGRDYGFVNEGTQWKYWGPGGERFGLPFPALRGAYQLNNAATVLAVIDLLRDVLPVRGGAVREGLLTVELPGRFQVLPGRPTVVLDVAHNPHAAGVLADELGAMGFFPSTNAVFGMFADKDVAGVAAAMNSRVDRWFVASLPGPRGAPADKLRDMLIATGVAASAVRVFPDIASAYQAARESAGEADRIVVFGSFLTVAAVLAATKR